MALVKTDIFAPRIKEVVLKKFPLTVWTSGTRFISNVDLVSYTDYMADQLVHYLSVWLLQGTHPQYGTTTYQIPLSWWQHFKRDNFPAWLLKRYPVKFLTKEHRYEKYINVCPHSDVKWPDAPHIRFLQYEGLYEDHYHQPIPPSGGDRESR
jgi:hypothetical protein